MKQDLPNPLKDFATLKSKYHATKYQDSSPSSLLYLILRKFDLGIEITEIELSWLKEQELFETYEYIYQQQEYKSAEIKKLEDEFSHLKSQYQVPKEYFKNISHILFPILWKLKSEKSLSNYELDWLKNNKLTIIINLAKKLQLEKKFLLLKSKYKANKYQGLSVNSPLYKILNKLENQEQISYPELYWLKKNELFETIKIVEEQESERIAEFIQLKITYCANNFSDTSTSTPLYKILNKLNKDENLIEPEFKWLEQQGLAETIAIAQELEQTREFANLKVKYQANQYHDLSPKSHLYKVLKILEVGNQLSEQDINFLKKRKLTETIEIARVKYSSTLKSKIDSGEMLDDLEIAWLKNNRFEDIITFAQQKHFAVLKLKYDISDYRDKSQTSPLYAILQKLETGERLEATDIAWLNENKIEAPPRTYSDSRWLQEEKLFSGKIRIAYHKIEANFYQQEFKHTGNKWNLANASSHWRKAYEPKQALELTDNLKLDTIKENKLKSALLTTRGGALRDIGELDKAENCALKAIDYQPKSHHPYTLMGAICFERHQYSDGEYWFEEAIKRGADPRDLDSEIRRVVKNTKDDNNRQKVVDYLLKKDPQRYYWAKSYLKKVKNKV